MASRPPSDLWVKSYTIIVISLLIDAIMLCYNSSQDEHMIHVLLCFAVVW